MRLTVSKISIRRKTTSSQLLTRMRSANGRPMPPAPTTSRMVAERVLDSKKYRIWLNSTGSTCGRIPKRITCRRLAHEARTRNHAGSDEPYQWRCISDEPHAWRRRHADSRRSTGGRHWRKSDRTDDSTGARRPLGRVTILERDHVDDRPALHQSIPQGHHLHGLLLGGQQVMVSWYPGILEQLDTLGAVRCRAGKEVVYYLPTGKAFSLTGTVRAPRDLGFDITCHSRGLLEYCGDYW